MRRARERRDQRAQILCVGRLGHRLRVQGALAAQGREGRAQAKEGQGDPSAAHRAQLTGGRGEGAELRGDCAYVGLCEPCGYHGGVSRVDVQVRLVDLILRWNEGGIRVGVMCGDDDTVLVAVWNEFIHYLGWRAGAVR